MLPGWAPGGLFLETEAWTTLDVLLLEATGLTVSPYVRWRQGGVREDGWELGGMVGSAWF